MQQLVRTAQDRPQQHKIGQDKTRQDKARQDKTRQDKTRPDRTGVTMLRQAITQRMRSGWPKADIAS